MEGILLQEHRDANGSCSVLCGFEELGLCRLGRMALPSSPLHHDLLCWSAVGSCPYDAPPTENYCKHDSQGAQICNCDVLSDL